MLKIMSAVILLILLVGCDKNINQPIATISPVSVPATNTPSLSPTLLPTVTLSPTTDISKRITGAETLCVNKQTDSNFEDLAQTSLVLGKTEIAQHVYNLLDFPRLQKKPIVPVDVSENVKTDFIKVSPNHEYYFYLECPTTKEHTFNDCSYVLNSKEKEIMRFPMDKRKEHWERYEWLDNESIVIFVSKPRDHMIVFNPFTGEEKDIPLALPHVQHYPTGTVAAMPNPSLQYVIYTTSKDASELVLWDMEKHQKIASIPYVESPYSRVYFSNWSPDGAKFIAVSSNENGDWMAGEIYLLELDGSVKQITHFTDNYSKVVIQSPVWSPDGQSLAFWVQVSSDAEEIVETMTWQLVVLDVATQKIKNLCIDYAKPQFSKSVELPVWSPDSNHLAVRVTDGYTWDKGSLLIIDLLRDTYNVLPVYENPIGWIQNNQ